MAWPMHLLPHVPQCCLFVFVSTQFPPQREKPALQTEPHAPLVQMAVALAGFAQTRAHCPQLLTFVCTSTQPPVHWMAGATHSVPHMPPMHVGRALTAPGHTMPHIPQFDVSVAVMTHEPVQSVVPVGQPSWQSPLVHTMAPVQPMPHIEQLS